MILLFPTATIRTLTITFGFIISVFDKRSLFLHINWKTLVVLINLYILCHALVSANVI